MSDRSTVLLEHHLKELKLPTFLREYGKVAGQCAAENVDHPGYLLRFSELELIDRHHRMVDRRIKAARFPATKSLDTFDFVAMPSVNKHLVMQLARCEYVDRRENVIAVGNSGTGKTHVALGLGLAACQQYAEGIEGQLFNVDGLHKAIDDIYRYPLRQSTVDTLNRQLRSGVDDTQRADIVMSLREEDRLCLTGDDAEVQEPQIICSLGLFDSEDKG